MGEWRDRVYAQAARRIPDPIWEAMLRAACASLAALDQPKEPSALERAEAYAREALSECSGSNVGIPLSKVLALLAQARDEAKR